MLEQEYYTSDEVFQMEMNLIFMKKWLFAGHQSQIPEAGDYFVFEVGKESLIITRDRAGEVRAFINICRHRGARLCTDGAGTFVGGIQCPYHAWTYALDGKLIGAPHMDEVEGFQKESYPLRPVSVATWEGLIFVNLDDNPEPFDSAFEPLIGKFSQWDLEELARVHRTTYEVEANWKLLFQNYSECYHCPSLHPQLNRLTPFRNSWNDLEEGPFLGGPMRMEIDGGSMTMSGQRCAAPLGDLTGEALNLVQYFTIFPNLLLSLHPDYVLLHRVDRLAVDRTRIVCDWLFHPDEMSRDDFDPSGAIEFWNLTNSQDWHVSELSQRGIASRAYRPGPYSELESMIAAWDREYVRSLEDGTAEG